jgi:predicted PurR-regulated permease PerM
MVNGRYDLTRITLAVLFIGGMIAASFLVLQPFLAATVWAATLVVATWPVLRRLESACGGRRGWAVTLMTLLLLVLVILPVSLAVAALVRNADVIADLPDAASNFRMPPPPAWVADLPVIGTPVAEKWRHLAASSTGEIVALVRPYIRTSAQWLVGAAGSVGGLILHLFLTIGIAAYLYANGEIAASWCRRFGRRLAAQRGEDAIILAGQAIKSVALGVVVTALAQTLVTGVALALAGVPHAGVLTGVALLLCIAQVGPALVVIPAIVWLFWSGATVGGIILLAVGVPAMLMDNVLRPILIRRGADLPLALILVGVIGGLVAFGLLGLFVGPVILGVAYTLLQHWMDEAKIPRSG